MRGERVQQLRALRHARKLRAALVAWQAQTLRGWRVAALVLTNVTMQGAIDCRTLGIANVVWSTLLVFPVGAQVAWHTGFALRIDYISALCAGVMSERSGLVAFAVVAGIT